MNNGFEIKLIRGEYTYSRLKEFDMIGNKNISSMKISPGIKLILFKKK